MPSKHAGGTPATPAMTEWLKQISPSPRHVGSIRCNHGWVEPQRFLHDHQLVLFTKGEFVVEFPDKTLDCHEGTYVIIPPGAYHVTRLHSRAGRRCWAHFDWVYRRDETHRPLMSYPPPKVQAEEICPAPPFVPRTLFRGPMPLPATLELHQTLEALWNTARPHEQLLARGVLLQLLVELLGPGADETPRASGRSSRHVQAIRDCLDRLVTYPIDDMPSIQAELEALGCSYAHGCRLFHATYGLAPLAYVHRLRIEQAKPLLRAGELSVAGVGRAVGIHNPAYFSRLFRNIVGLSPRQYVAANHSKKTKKMSIRFPEGEKSSPCQNRPGTL